MKPTVDVRAGVLHTAGGKGWWRFGGSFWWAASIFLAGLGAKFALIAQHGLAMPYLDQWPAEGGELFTPYYNGSFSLATLFAPHNEHHIVFTRVLELALLLLNGQWDSLLEMACNAVIHCAGLAGFAWFMSALLGKRTWPVLWVLTVLDLALPFAWENTLWGFQSSFYFLILFSWLTLGLLGLNEPYSKKWWLGVLAAVAAVFSLATGMIVLAAVTAMRMGQSLTQKNRWRKELPTWAVCVVLIAVGFLLKPTLPGHEINEPHSLMDLARAVGKCVAWPWATRFWLAPVNLLPIGLLAWFRLRSGQPASRAELMVFGIFIWAVLQGLAAAYARGVGGGAPAWRYMDLLSFISFANALSLCLLLARFDLRGGRRMGIATAGTVWTLVCLGGLVFLTLKVYGKYLGDADAEQSAKLATARAFMRTGDTAVFARAADEARPILNVDADVWMFRNPYLRPILPACVRDPLRIVPTTSGNAAFARNGWLPAEVDPTGDTGWGSYSTARETATGTFESEPIEPGRLPYLEIPVAGDLGQAGLTLELIELKSGKVTRVIPPAVPKHAWLNVQVRTPTGSFKLVARDQSDTGWFAFKEPREMGRLSVWTLRCLSGWPYLVVLGAGVFLLSLVQWRREAR